MGQQHLPGTKLACDDPGNQTFSTAQIPKVVGGEDAVSDLLAVTLYNGFISKTVAASSAGLQSSRLQLSHTDLQAAVGIVQLRKLDDFINERSRAARYYKGCLSRLNWLKPPPEEPVDSRHAWQSYVSCVDEQKAPMPRNQ